MKYLLKTIEPLKRHRQWYDHKFEALNALQSLLLVSPVKGLPVETIERSVCLISVTDKMHEQLWSYPKEKQGVKNLWKLYILKERLMNLPI